jgi:hypothetical protein
VRAIRNARAEYGVEEKRRIAATLIVSDPALRASLAGELASIALLAKLDPSAVTVVDADAASPEGGAASSVSLVVQDGVVVLLPMAGLFDVEKEVARLSKQRAKIEKVGQGAPCAAACTAALRCSHLSGLCIARSSLLVTRALAGTHRRREQAKKPEVYREGGAGGSGAAGWGVAGAWRAFDAADRLCCPALAHVHTHTRRCAVV